MQIFRKNSNYTKLCALYFIAAIFMLYNFMIRAMDNSPKNSILTTAQEKTVACTQEFLQSVKLVANDKETSITIPLEIATLSKTIRNALKHFPNQSVILPAIDPATLKHLEFLLDTHAPVQAGKPVNWKIILSDRICTILSTNISQETLWQAINYLDISELVEPFAHYIYKTLPADVKRNRETIKQALIKLLEYPNGEKLACHVAEEWDKDIALYSLEYDKYEQNYERAPMKHKRLHCASFKGNLKKVVRLSTSPFACDVNDRDFFGRTPLHYAAQQNQCAVVLALLKAGADGNASDLLGNTPLHVAAAKGHTEVARKLVEEKAFPSAVNHHIHGDCYYGETAIHLAFELGRKDGHFETFDLLQNYTKVRKNAAILTFFMGGHPRTGATSQILQLNILGDRELSKNIIDRLWQCHFSSHYENQLEQAHAGRPPTLNENYRRYINGEDPLDEFEK